MSIIIIQKGVPTRLAPTEFALENAMQEQINSYPNILPLHEVHEGAELIAVVRELPVSSGSIDLLGFDAEGEIYVIETKLSLNPDRRKVVAQALDYGAALWIDYPEPGALISAVNELRARARGSSLREALLTAHEGNEEDADESLKQIETNLAKGAFRFVIPMDRIDESMKNLVRYVNENSQFSIYLVELEQYQQGDLTVVVPRLFGAEARKTVGASPMWRGSRSNEAEFESDMEDRIAKGEMHAPTANALRMFLPIVAQGTDARWSRGTQCVNVSPRFPSTGATRSPFTLKSDGRIELNFAYVREVPAWGDWAGHVRDTLGLSGDSRAHIQLKPTEWVPFAPKMAALTVEVLGRTDSVVAASRE